MKNQMRFTNSPDCSSSTVTRATMVCKEKEDYVYVRELVVRYRQRRIKRAGAQSARVSTPNEVVSVFRSVLQDEAVEVCALLCLSTRGEVVAFHELSRGTI